MRFDVWRLADGDLPPFASPEEAAAYTPKVERFQDLRRVLRTHERWEYGPAGGEQDLKTEVVERAGVAITVHYVPKEVLHPAFGWASGGNEVWVRADLSPRVQRFVLAHELYHCTDRANWGGWIGRELRANLIPGLKDPLGMLAAFFASLNRERLRFYGERLKRGK